MNQEARFSRLEPELRKANLIEATLACLKLYGFQGASVRKISARAGVSVGLINHHYRGKDELVAEAYLTITSRVQGLLRGAVDAAPAGARSRLSAFFHGSFCAELLDPQLLDAWLAFWGAMKTAEAISLAHEHSYGEYRALLRDVLLELAAEEGWGAFDAELAAISLSALLDGLWLESGLNPGTFSPAQGIQICEAWVDGLQSGGHRRFCAASATSTAAGTKHCVA
ncbi:TetR family transcriptional regulator C-terminal domain-containing protein [Pseudomonas putida]